ncbi:hypothetical protein DB345_05935 [Spartobacteria bacterium LR76]|nr:hypothetical protein DB345_05935 [Spartobacteria bacterium LR76]
MSSPVLCGIDAGGTSCRAMVVSADGSRLGKGHSSGGNPNHYGWERSGISFLEAVNAACQEARISISDIVGLYVGAASIVTASDREAVKSLVKAWPLRPGCAVGVDHDIRIALEGGLGGRAGIALIAGTGSSCYGRNSSGETWQAGGWDQLLDDLGSGYDIAQKGLAAACREADGRGEKTFLRELCFGALGVDNIADFAVKLHRPKWRRHEIAALAPLVFEAASRKDSVARVILNEAARQLADMVTAVQIRVFPARDPEIIFSGGLLEHSSDYSERVRREILDQLPGARIRQREAPPVVGAVSLAAKEAGVSFDYPHLNLSF